MMENKAAVTCLNFYQHFPDWTEVAYKEGSLKACRWDIERQGVLSEEEQGTRKEIILN
jgi:hypothetical protein